MSLDNRFYCIASKKNYYVYDKYSNSINKIDNDLFIALKKGNFDIKSYTSEKQRQTLSFLLSQKEPIISYYSDEKCYVSINLSSSCNMNCTYCFKAAQPKLQKESITKIFKYITEIYYPNAKEYIFSVGYSSEPLLDLELIDYLDELIAKKEGFLFGEEDFLYISPQEVLQELLNICETDLSEWLKDGNNAIEIINSIIENIDINNFLDDSFLATIDPFYYNYILMSKISCKSKRVQINRRIVEKLFPEKIKVFNYEHYYTICFMTNGLAITSDSIQYLKRRYLKNICISLDGNKQIHDSIRKTINGKGTYDVIVKKIKLLQKNELDVCISCVITPEYLNLIKMFEHFSKLGVSKIDFHYVRDCNTYKGFSEKSIEELNLEINKLYARLKSDLEQSDYHLFRILKDSKLFFFVKLILRRRFNITRCKWGDEIVFDTQGNMYLCQYMINAKSQKVGDFSSGKKHSEILKPIFTSELDLCKSCWAEYICGGTCHYSSFVTEGNLYKTNRVECKYNKNLIINSLDFCIFLIENDLYKKVYEILEAE